MVIFAFSDSPTELANGRSLFVFMIPVIVASILLRPASSFLLAAISSIEIVILAGVSATPINTFAIIGFFLVAFIAWLSARSLEQALKDLRVINTNLDNLVTERTQALSESLTRERIEAGRNQAILNSIADGVIVFNAENSSILANPALSDLIKTPSEDLTAISLNEFVQTADLSGTSQKMIRELIEQPERSESGVRVEWGKKSLSVGVARVQDTATRENIGAVAVFRDVTREAELEKMKENFVAVVSHELRTPLNALMGLTEMLQEGIYGAMNEKQVSITERLMTNITRLLSMVGDLLDEAQIGAGKLSINPQVFKTASLLENLHSTMDKIAIDKGLALSSNLDPSLPQNIVGDHQRLQQILVNLVTNAIKFTEKGGVHVSILREEQDHWKIEVTDTGIGIAETEVPYIFETFRQASNTAMRTRQHGGFGLGLSIVKQLVELMNGRITVASQTEQGSTFTVLLPLETAQY
jgi:signal transduction histidine kinase